MCAYKTPSGKSDNIFLCAYRLALCCKSGTEFMQFYEYLKNHTEGRNQ